MTTPGNRTRTELSTDESRQATVERPVLKVLIVSLILAGIAAVVLTMGFNF